MEATSDQPDFVTNKIDRFKIEKTDYKIPTSAPRSRSARHQLGHKSVYGIDEQSQTIYHFPFDQVEVYAKAQEQSAALSRMQKKVEHMVKQMETAQKTNRSG